MEWHRNLGRIAYFGDNGLELLEKEEEAEGEVGGEKSRERMEDGDRKVTVLVQ